MTTQQDERFKKWFQAATGSSPFPFQAGFACEPTLPEFVDVPTGLGKTAMAVLGWIWRRRFHPDEAIQKVTPRRLVYCLPRRVLVEQTFDCARSWLSNLKCHGKPGERNKISVHMLKGGEDEEDWDMYPEYEQILIGTQDMLLSRALNRGYAATRSRWPIKFGLLNTDCLWVFDEVQLMGAGLATTSQLQAFRRLLPDKDTEVAKNSHGCHSVWMSATMRPDWLKTVDFAKFLDSTIELTFNFEHEIATGGLDETARQVLGNRWWAKKPLAKAEVTISDVAGLAQEVYKVHRPGTRTIVIVNTVKRACELLKALKFTADRASSSELHLVLLHSRFRPGDRKKQVEKALRRLSLTGRVPSSSVRKSLRQVWT